MAGRKKWRVALLGGRAAAEVLLACLFAVGCVVGCVAAGLLRDPQGELADYLRGYLSLAEQGRLSPEFWGILWRTVRAAVAVILLGMTALGVVGIPLLFLMEGFALCYAVSVFYRSFGPAGLAPALILFGFSAMIWLPVLLGLGSCRSLRACVMLRRVTGDGRSSVAGGDGVGPIRYGICVIALLLCAGIEYAIVPTLLQEIAGSFLTG